MFVGTLTLVLFLCALVYFTTERRQQRMRMGKRGRSSMAGLMMSKEGLMIATLTPLFHLSTFLTASGRKKETLCG